MEFHAGDALRVSGLSYKQIDHTIRSGWLRDRGGGKSGLPRLFTRCDLVALAVLHDVLGARIPAGRVAPALRLIQRSRRLNPMSGTLVWTDGRTATIVQRGEPVRMKPGTVHYVLDLGNAAQRVNERLEKLRKNAA
jgi:hypothetical protein